MLVFNKLHWSYKHLGAPRFFWKEATDMIDITCVFTLGVLMTPLIFVTDLQGVINYFTLPSVVASFVALFGFLYYTHWTAAGRKECVTLNSRDRR